jgi:gliding motility-associated-like protein
VLVASAAGGTGNINFTWLPGNFQNNSIIVAPLVTTTYTVMASDQNGCQAQEPVAISVFSAPLPAFSATGVKGCPPFCPTFTDITPNPIGSTIIARNWDFGDGKVGAGEVVDHCFTESGSLAINLTITTDKGCRRVLETQDYITVFPLPEALFTAIPTETTISNPSIIFNNVSSNGVNYMWNFGDNDSIFTKFEKNHTYQDTGLFEVQLVAVSAQGCIDSVKSFIKINPYYTFFIPSSFTPNGDGKNDVFEVHGDFIQTCSMQVFDRWGKILFNQSGGKNVSWDADNTPQGTYMYKIKMKDTQNKDYEYVGSFTVLR